MELKPVRTDRPAYPTYRRARRRSGWLKRIAVAAGASAALWMSAGCERPWDIGGVMMPPEPPSCTSQVEATQIDVPGSFSSTHCHESVDQANWGTFELQLNTPLRFSFSMGAELSEAEILDEEGLVVDILGPEEDSMELVLPPGLYYVAVRPSQDGMYYESFTLDIDFAE